MNTEKFWKPKPGETVKIRILDSEASPLYCRCGATLSMHNVLKYDHAFEEFKITGLHYRLNQGD